jgi:hypothetical protein
MSAARKEPLTETQYLIGSYTIEKTSARHWSVFNADRHVLGQLLTLKQARMLVRGLNDLDRALKAK